MCNRRLAANDLYAPTQGSRFWGIKGCSSRHVAQPSVSGEAHFTEYAILRIRSDGMEPTIVRFSLSRRQE